MNIGLLEDNAGICNMLDEALTLAGHHVCVYSKPTTFLAAVIPEHAPTTPASFDLLIIDLLLPEVLSGLQVLHSVKMHYPDLPVILISAASRFHIVAALEDLPGVKAFRKPFKVSDLLAAIQAHISAAENADAHCFRQREGDPVPEKG